MDKRQMLRLSSSFQRQCSTLRMEAFENDDPDGILAFKFLWIDYEPRCFWWELVEVTKRVFFCAFLSIVQYGSKLQIFVALCASILYEAMLHQFEPFVFDEDDAIALTACWSILVTLLLSCMLRVGVLSPSAWYATALLIGAALAPIFVVIVGGRVDVTGYDKNEGPGGGDKPLAPRDYYT
ncbi:alpha-ketoglutarate-dependent dioxygenase alkB-like protein [Aureococcus anophagefferens]|nr:alpha-ketoglutarate-dependent dioxygenase alkB-like protein [Aureococcus anophagefferens]